MKVLFDHIEGFGKVKHHDFIYSAPYGVLEKDESPAEALKYGWIPWGEYWYNLRSVRIDLSIYEPARTTIKQSKKIFAKHGDIKTKSMIYQQLYEEYCDHHSFERNISIEEFKDCSVIEYYTKENNELIAISFYKIYEDQFVAFQFIWNYKDPKLSMGNVAQMMECFYAQERYNATHVYLLGGYEECCAYKSNFKGFEFWTGKKWSRDKALYENLVKRDEQIKIEL